MSVLPRPRWSLRQIAVFESAARNGNFSRAAVELGMTQAAVSTAMKGLEDCLKVSLFRRLHRGAELTPAGARLYKDVAAGLAQIDNGVEAVRPWREGRHVTLSVSTAFATYWLLPRLDDFRRLHPGIDLRIVTTDRDLDIRQDGIALGIRYGVGVLPHYRTARLAAETIYRSVRRATLENCRAARACFQHPTLLAFPAASGRAIPSLSHLGGLVPGPRPAGSAAAQRAALQRLRSAGAGSAGRCGHCARLGASPRPDDRTRLAGAARRGRADDGNQFSHRLGGRTRPQALAVRDWLVAQGATAKAGGLSPPAAALRQPA